MAALHGTAPSCTSNTSLSASLPYSLIKVCNVSQAVVLSVLSSLRHNPQSTANTEMCFSLLLQGSELTELLQFESVLTALKYKNKSRHVESMQLKTKQIASISTSLQFKTQVSKFRFICKTKLAWKQACHEKKRLHFQVKTTRSWFSWFRHEPQLTSKPTAGWAITSSKRSCHK